MITTEKIKLFDNYKGDIDGFTRREQKSKLNLFEAHEWALLDSFYQDIELLNKRLVSKYYAVSFLAELRKKCDQDGLAMLTDRINCLTEF
ncbi:hypothetical protein [Mucilaginibacter paludis]|uniref:Uncharacterized protein n=1 Tax=Mucilaginibacter paludis DSM 18603 TaxID=714943 RepID=H1Y3R5_9SPHI|nr:hypothetical protein [Mucilaginibacter paludis]EHQ30327.1 hypothetical protein Mucpa_6271 [Mucilaginibacter paludis DSM 18603]